MRKMPPLSDHLLRYEKAPDSLAFAPLAESYRRLGMYPEALKVLKKGLSLHSRYLPAQVVLAHVYYDTECYEEALALLRPLAAKNLENYTLQRLYADSCLQLGLRGAALEALRGLLFLSPRDRGVAQSIARLEQSLPPSLRGAREGSGEGDSAPLEGWVQVDFRSPPASIALPEGGGVTSTAQGSGPALPEGPLATHTLVDLYESQGLAHRAAQVLEKMVRDNPGEASSVERLHGLRRDLSRQDIGHEELMGVWAEKFCPSSSSSSWGGGELATPRKRGGRGQGGGDAVGGESDVVGLLQNFLDAIKARAGYEKSAGY